MNARNVSPGLPADSDTAVEWVEAPAPYLGADGVPSLAAPYGFGAATTGGTGGTVLHVHKSADKPDDPPKGTLRWATQQAGPTWIVFDEDLTIALAEPLPLTAHTTLDGRGHRVTIGGVVGGLELRDVENVVVHNLTLRGFGDPETGHKEDPHDAVAIYGARRIWLDRLDLSEAIDKVVGVGHGGREVTITRCHLHDQKTTVQIGNMSTATASLESTVTLARNHFDRCGLRQPTVSYGKAHVFNNLYDHWINYAVRSQRIAQVFLEGNVFDPTDDNPKATTTEPADDGANDALTREDDRPGWLCDVANLYLGKCRKDDTGTDHMFDPHKAYAYAVAEATEELAATIAAEAGPV